ncbi:hypothetical protein QTV49_004653 [Vibrio vulnificus]|nr:hypothetical protein [Vibrio vulnificus]
MISKIKSINNWNTTVNPESLIENGYVVLKSTDEGAPPLVVEVKNNKFSFVPSDEDYFGDFGNQFEKAASIPSVESIDEWTDSRLLKPEPSNYVLVNVSGESKPRVAWAIYWQPKNTFSQFVFPDVQDSDLEEELNKNIVGWIHVCSS